MTLLDIREQPLLDPFCTPGSGKQAGSKERELGRETLVVRGCWKSPGDSKALTGASYV